MRERERIPDLPIWRLEFGRAVRRAVLRLQMSASPRAASLRLRLSAPASLRAACTARGPWQWLGCSSFSSDLLADHGGPVVSR
jgi:hypothetical protein